MLAHDRKLVKAVGHGRSTAQVKMRVGETLKYLDLCKGIYTDGCIHRVQRMQASTSRIQAQS